MRTHTVLRWCVLLAIVFAAVIGRQPTLARADGPGAAAAAVVLWNGIAVKAIVNAPAPTVLPPDAGAGLPPAYAVITLGYVQGAVYNAVMAIEGGYAPYHSSLPRQPDASVDAAVAAAAYRVLTDHLTALQETNADLAGKYASALAAIPNSPAKDAGILLGQAAADEMLALRAGDGYVEPGVAYPYLLPAPGPGVFELTPPAAAALTPWVATMQPFLMNSANQFDPGRPVRLDSRRYAQDYNEVLLIGRDTSTTRTADQTDAARFWTDNPARQNNTLYTALIVEHGFDAAEAARLYAMGNMVSADAAIACWEAKYHYLTWRPQTAINRGDTDGNPATTAVPDWKPLIGTPPHPEYPGGHGCVTSALAEVLTEVLGTDEINITMTSASALPVINRERTFATAADLRQEIIDVRIWSGIHFREADEAGAKMGQKLAKWALNHFFGESAD